MNAAEELRAAAAHLRQARFPAAMTATPQVAALIRARLPLAVLLEGIASDAVEADHEHLEGPHWCTPETCDLSAALAVARALAP